MPQKILMLRTTTLDRDARRLLRKVWLGMGALALLAALQAWLSDFFMAEKTWTVYAASCSDGQTPCRQPDRPIDRISFKVHKESGQVDYWLRERGNIRGVMSDCSIHDARNWSCPTQPGVPLLVPTRVVQGMPAPTDALPFATVSKGKWLLLKLAPS